MERAAKLCYHRHRRSSTDIFATTAVVKIVCLDCGASAEAGYGAPIPDLPPMPIEVVAAPRVVCHCAACESMREVAR